ncbi:MAG: hypothetical protein LAO04_21690 [Acidobacteriia bacterium]|nr:hypothetical protein [Terriglobia bacterium]
MSEIDQAELDRRASLIVEQFEGIHPPYEAFYIRSIAYSAGRARDAFLRFEAAKAVRDTADNQVSSIHEALGHATSLSRFFWPSGLRSRSSAASEKPKAALKKLKDARALKLRNAFDLNDESPLKNRKLRDSLEHFDERLDSYLLKQDCGYFFPDAMIGDLEAADNPVGHLFKLVDPDRACFVLLGEAHYFGALRKEVERIHDLAMTMGCRLRSVRTSTP